MAELGYDPLEGREVPVEEPATDEIPVVKRDTAELPAQEPQTDTVLVLAPRARRPTPWPR